MLPNKSDQGVLEKIKKLFALAEGNQNENERDAAMRMAMSLLAKHNLSVSELYTPENDVSVIEVKGDFRLEPWVKSVLSAACTLYYTDFFIGSSYDWLRDTQTNYPVFVGTADNIAVTIEVATWLLDSVRLESNRLFKTARERRSFRLGAARRLNHRAYLIVNEERKSDSVNALMVLRNKLQAANDDYLKSLNLTYRSQRSSRVIPSAYVAGQEFANQVSLSNANGTNKQAMAMLPLYEG